MTPARQELRDLIAAKIAAEHRRRATEKIEDSPEGHAQGFADAIMPLFYRVGDEWESIEISTLQDGPGGRYLDQRWLVARITTSDTRERNMVPKRAVTS